MANFIRAGHRLVNLDHVVEIEVSPAHGEYFDGGERMPAMPTVVNIVTTAIASHVEYTGYEDSGAVAMSQARQIRLSGLEAEEFLRRVHYTTEDADGVVMGETADAMAKGAS